MVFKSASEEKRSKIKIGIFTTMFLMHYFCLHGILPFSESYPEMESTWKPAVCRGRKSFDPWYYIVTCATLCVSFSSKPEAIHVFPKHILKSKARDQLVQASKKLFDHVIVKNYLCNVSFDQKGFWSKSKARGGAKSKNRHPADFTVP